MMPCSQHAKMIDWWVADYAIGREAYEYPSGRIMPIGIKNK